MAFTYEQILEDKYARHAAEVAEANAELERARLQEDDYSTRAAADRLNQLNLERRSMDEIASNFAASQQRAQPQNRYGLSKDEVDIARGIASGDRAMSNDDREKLYAEQKSRYRRMRATGEYRDDQGTVRR